MNIYFVIAGAMGVLGGLAHTILGDRWTVAILPEEHLASDQNTGAQNKRYLRWFWHVGSVVLLSTSAIILLAGLRQLDVQRQLLMYISFLWLATTAVFFVVTLKPPIQSWKMVPGLVGIPINLLILAGLYM